MITVPYLRLVVVGLSVVALSAGVWKIYSMGYKASEAKHAAIELANREAASKESFRALEAGLKNRDAADNILKGKTDALNKIKAVNINLGRSLARVLDAANTCTSEAMRAGEATIADYGTEPPRYVVKRR